MSAPEYTCKSCNKKYKSKGCLINHEKKCSPKPSSPKLEESSTLENIMTPAPTKDEQKSDEPSEQKQYSENELIILKASDFDRMITEYLKIFMDHYNSQMNKLIDENRELVTYSNTLAEILKSLVCAKKSAP